MQAQVTAWVPMVPDQILIDSEQSCACHMLGAASRTQQCSTSRLAVATAPAHGLAALADVCLHLQEMAPVVLQGNSAPCRQTLPAPSILYISSSSNHCCNSTAH